MRRLPATRSGSAASTGTLAGSSVALAQAGITRKTAEVAGGRILRDDSGEPTGVLVDNAMDLVERALPQPSGSELEAAHARQRLCGSAWPDRRA